MNIYGHGSDVFQKEICPFLSGSVLFSSPFCPWFGLFLFVFSSSLGCLSRLLQNILVFSQRSQTRLGPRGGIFWYFAILQTFKRVVFLWVLLVSSMFSMLQCCFCMFLYVSFTWTEKETLGLDQFSSLPRKGKETCFNHFNLIHCIRSLFWTVWLTVISSLNHDGATFTWDPRQVPCLRKRKGEKM